MLAILAKFYGSIYCLKQRFLVNAGNDEVALVDGFGTFGTCTDADGRERMAYACEEAAFLGKCPTVADYCKSIHLKTVIIMKAQRLMLNDTFVKSEAARGKAIARARMTTVEDGHIVLPGHFVDGIE